MLAHDLAGHRFAVGDAENDGLYFRIVQPRQVEEGGRPVAGAAGWNSGCPVKIPSSDIFGAEADYLLQQFERRRVGPMKILHDQYRRAPQRNRLNGGDQNFDRTRPAPGGRGVSGGYRSPVGIERNAAISGAASGAAIPSSLSRSSIRSSCVSALWERSNPIRRPISSITGRRRCAANRACRAFQHVEPGPATRRRNTSTSRDLPIPGSPLSMMKRATPHLTVSQSAASAGRVRARAPHTR